MSLPQGPWDDLCVRDANFTRPDISQSQEPWDVTSLTNMDFTTPDMSQESWDDNSDINVDFTTPDMSQEPWDDNSDINVDFTTPDMLLMQDPYDDPNLWGDPYPSLTQDISSQVEDPNDINTQDIPKDISRSSDPSFMQGMLPCPLWWDDNHINIQRSEQNYFLDSAVENTAIPEKRIPNQQPTISIHLTDEQVSQLVTALSNRLTATSDVTELNNGSPWPNFEKRTLGKPKLVPKHNSKRQIECHDATMVKRVKFSIRDEKAVCEWDFEHDAATEFKHLRQAMKQKQLKEIPK